MTPADSPGGARSATPEPGSDEPAVCRRADAELTGAAADHRLAVASRDVALVAQAIAAELKVGDMPPLRAQSAGRHRRACKLDPAVAAIWPPTGASVWSSPARRSRPRFTRLRISINHALGNIGKTVDFIARVDAGPADQIGSLRELVNDCERRTGRHADHSGRKPGLRCPGGPRVRKAAEERQDQASHPPRPV